MNIRRKISSILACAVLFVFSLTTLIFSACNKNEKQSTDNTSQSTEEDTPQSTEISLNLNNYSEYFILQEEILSYNQTDYTQTIGAAKYYKAKVNQTTKLSVILLKENIKFNKVILTIINDTATGFTSCSTGAAEYNWNGDGGNLNLSYNGSGFLTLTATYDGDVGNLSRHPMKYKISKIEGSISV